MHTVQLMNSDKHTAERNRLFVGYTECHICVSAKDKKEWSRSVKLAVLLIKTGQFNAAVFFLQHTDICPNATRHKSTRHIRAAGLGAFVCVIKSASLLRLEGHLPVRVLQNNERLLHLVASQPWQQVRVADLRELNV